MFHLKTKKKKDRVAVVVIWQQITWSKVIRTLSADQSAPETAQKAVSLRERRQRARRFAQLSTATSYAAVLALIASIVSVGYQSPVDQQVASRGLSTAAIEVTNPSVDQIVAADLAATTAQVANLSIASNASNLSISLNAKGSLAQTNDTVLSKPQIVELAGEHRGIIEYTTVAGDSAQSVAEKFGISAQTLKWANNLASDALVPGKQLSIPGTDGVVYTVVGGDTIDSIARKYGVDSQRIVTYNDLEVSGVSAGQRLVLPGGVLPENERPETIAAAQSAAASRAPAVTQRYSPSAVSVGNRYDYGYCTWYVYNRRAELGRPVGSFWGNAVSWASFASSSGYRVDNNPEVGSILQVGGSVAGGYGHVAVVENVYPDGSIRVSEMNYSGWSVISSRTIDAGQARSYNYIH